MPTNSTETSRQSVNSHLALVIFIFLGTYVASFVFFSLPLVIPPILFNLFIIIVALPSLYFFHKWAGLTNTLLVILILSVSIFFIEGIGVLTGLPYGQFFYSDFMGPKLFGLVPWAIPFAFIPLLLGSVAFVTKFVEEAWKIILLSALFLVAIDLVIDPILVYLGIWVWITPGVYYGIPLSNFLGWFFTGIFTSSILYFFVKFRVDLQNQLPIIVTLSLVLTLSFWSGFAFWTQLVIPFVISLILLGLLLAAIHRYYR